MRLLKRMRWALHVNGNLVKVRKGMRVVCKTGGEGWTTESKAARGASAMRVVGFGPIGGLSIMKVAAHGGRSGVTRRASRKGWARRCGEMGGCAVDWCSGRARGWGRRDGLTVVLFVVVGVLAIVRGGAAVPSSILVVADVVFGQLSVRCIISVHLASTGFLPMRLGHVHKAT
jgi:hypothetical protein